MSVTEPLREFLAQKRNVQLPEGASIEVDEIYQHVAEFNKACPFQTQGVDVADLLKDSQIVYRTNDSTSSRSMSEMEQMRAQAEERRYQRSISNLGISSNLLSMKSDVRSASESISFATHFILAFISAFLVGYYLGEYVFDFRTEEYKYILGGACSFATLILESILFIIREEKKTMVALKPKKPLVTTERVFQTSAETNIMKKIGNENDLTIRKRIK